MGYDQLQKHQYSMIDTFYEAEINTLEKIDIYFVTWPTHSMPKDVNIYVLYIYFKKTKTDSSTGNLLFNEEYGFVSSSTIWTEVIGTNKNTAAKT